MEAERRCEKATKGRQDVWTSGERPRGPSFFRSKLGEGVDGGRGVSEKGQLKEKRMGTYIH